jgi:hypothetical protein
MIIWPILQIALYEVSITASFNKELFFLLNIETAGVRESELGEND